MSEYQYYEFQAIDRPLTTREMAALRACSTRARITPTGFVNEYQWGNLKGDPAAWMAKYFDAHLYFANWGDHVLMLRLPTEHLGLAAVQPYVTRGSVQARVKADKLVLTLQSVDEGSGDFADDGEEPALSALVPLRSELAQGDLRALYLGWLLDAQRGAVDEDELEPPVPPGLGHLSASLRSLAEFMRLDAHLLAAAAKASAPASTTAATLLEARAWLKTLSKSAQQEALATALLDDGAMTELRRRFRGSLGTAGRARSKAPGARRTVRQLLEAGETLSARRRPARARRGTGRR